MDTKLQSVVETLADVVSRSDDLEQMVRPILGLIETVTGLETSYLTSVDKASRHQKVLFARNSKEMEIPEGIEVEWSDSLCKRALDEQRFHVDNVPVCWSDSTAARELAIVTYISQPIHVVEGEFFGTLCAASSQSISVDEESMRLLSFFGNLIGRQIERERLITTLGRDPVIQGREPIVDPLTGISNRRALMDELQRSLEIVERSKAALHVAFVDLDGVKRINEQYGNEAGNQFLSAMVDKLTHNLRMGDFIARYGDDELVILGLDFTRSSPMSAEIFRKRIQTLTKGSFTSNGNVIDYPGADVGVITVEDKTLPADVILTRIDAALYARKKKRKQQAFDVGND